MDVDTGHLMRNHGMTEEEMAENGYEKVPDFLELQAELELAGRDECYVGKKASGSLSKHMRYKRKKKQQMAKASRRKNRAHSG